MGYSIRYDKRHTSRRHTSLLWSILAAAFGAMIWYLFTQTGLLLSLEEMAQAIQNGETLKEAFNHFYLEILENAKLG